MPDVKLLATRYLGFCSHCIFFKCRFQVVEKQKMSRLLYVQTELQEVQNE